MAVYATNGKGLAKKVTGLLKSLNCAELPIFLCPTLLRPGIGIQRQLRAVKPAKNVARSQTRCLHSAVDSTSSRFNPLSEVASDRLPPQCVGCGAYSQTVDKEEAGYYTLSRGSVKTYLGEDYVSISSRSSQEEQLLVDSLGNVDREIITSFRREPVLPKSALQPTTPPLCDRCHKLLHHQSGVSIHHPTIRDIQETLLESPHKYNHIYHVIDAADFPMSLIPTLHKLLHLTPQRSLNRRSKTGRFYHGRKTEVSFIITRSDLLAPLKTQVDSLMPYLVEVLRDALGSFGKDVRLGNVRCVSAKRGWWTKELKEDIWKRGGGGWMVGKVNVGKSQLFESVFPKGRRGIVKVDQPISTDPIPAESAPILEVHEGRNGAENSSTTESAFEEDYDMQEAEPLDASTLLPPAQIETDYPAMPLVSPLPGTTASPIRVPFGNGKGELVDLPGLSRGDLELHVQERHRPSLVMRSRVVPEQQVIKPGQSLLLGGFIRITPTTPDDVILAYAFTPVKSHLTSTRKAIEIQIQESESKVLNIANAGIGRMVKSAGTFSLKWDVTKKRTGPITSSSAANIKLDKLPYQVMSTDVLIEGCGWVELVAQVRKKKVESAQTLDTSSSITDGDANGRPIPKSMWPEVEVFSPEGRFISSRRPLGAWILGGQKKPTAGQKGRPRQSMKGVKKHAKASARLEI